MRARISVVVVVAGLLGCGQGPTSDGPASNGGWDCHDVALAHGHETVCQSSSAGSGGSYTCEPVSGGAPSGAGNVQPHNTTDGTLTSPSGSSSSGSGSTTDGTSSPGSSSSSSGSPSCPPGTVPVATSGGSAGPNGSNATTGSNGGTDDGDSSNPNGGSDGTSGKGGSSGTSGSNGSTDDGSGWQCSSSGGGTTCTSPPSCDSGYHAACGTCVADGSSASCGGSTGGGPGASSGGTNGANGCTLTQGYWKNHAGAWPVQSLTLGATTYTQSQLLAIMGTAPGGDASLILADQLIATLLSTDAGASAAPIAAVIAQAQAWLTANAGGKTLPLGVSSASSAGAQAVALAGQLDAYNNGMSGVPHCN